MICWSCNFMSLTSSLIRFKLVQKTGQACTALAFNLRRTTEFLVALADYSIKCFDKGETHYNFLTKTCTDWIVLTSMISCLQTPDSSWAGCGVMKVPFPPCPSTAQVASPSARLLTPRSSGALTPSRERGSSMYVSRLAYKRLVLFNYGNFVFFHRLYAWTFQCTNKHCYSSSSLWLKSNN